MNNMLVRIKGYKKVTKNGKEVVLVLIEDIMNNRTFFLNRGFDVTMEVPSSEIERLVKSGVLWDSSQKSNTNDTKNSTAVEDVV